MISFKKMSPATGKIQGSVSSKPKYLGNLPANPCVYLIRTKRPDWCKEPGVFVKEATLLQVYKNVGKFQYNNNQQVSVDLTSDTLLGTITKSTGNKDAFPINCIPNRDIISWNAYADFRVWEELRHTFEGVNLEAIKVFDARKGADLTPVFYPKHPRFQVGEIALTNYEPEDVDTVEGVHYGYIRIERITEEFEPVGVDKLSLVNYTVRRSWKNITVEEWNHFSKLKDRMQNTSITINKLPASVQSKVRRQLFDPFYR